MPGMMVKKKCESPMRGPIVLEKQGVLYAVSRSLAQRIIVATPVPHQK
jgi:Fe2+ transport system protein FeoA